MIKAYHQVGTDSMSSGKRAELFDRILKLGTILPAIERVQRREMKNECFSPLESYGEPIWSKFQLATRKAMAAIEKMAKEVIEQLPEEGTTHTLFNCTDLLAGDLGRLFLSIGGWYTGFKNGFVYDAQDLLMRGAMFRPFDLLGHFNSAITEAAKLNYKTVGEARGVIESMIYGEIEDRSYTGKEGIDELDACIAGAGDYQDKPGCPSGEIVWEGRLPVSLATEAWRDEEQIL
jgi:hypothetical protein